MHIVIEGPDGAGKTTLIEKIKGHATIPSCKPKNYPEYLGRLKEHIDLLNRPNRPSLVFDRSPIISEYVYGTMFRDRCLVSRQYVENYLLEYAFPKCMFIICLPGLEVVQNNAANRMQNKPYKPEEYISQVRINIPALYRSYEQDVLGMFDECCVTPYIYRYPTDTDIDEILKICAD